jgi:hypothetical protein
MPGRILDREDVRRRYAAGERQADIARSYGVTQAAVHHVLNRCRSCAAGCGREVIPSEGRSGVCIDCYRRSISLASCPKGHDFERMHWRQKSDGTLHRECMECDRERSAQRRAARQVPCVDCGELCAGRDKRFGPGPSRCRSCNARHITQVVAA